MQNKVLAKTLKELLPDRYTQITESHCGPAVIQMLLANLGIIASQEKITEIGDAKETIDEMGMRVDQLAKAVHGISKNVKFWTKEYSSVEDLDQIINTYNYPVAVEWQGVFDSYEEESQVEDPERCGHYSIVTYIDTGNLIIVDPFKDFANQDRIFTIGQFVPRWWDTNKAMDRSGNIQIKKDERLIFIVTPFSTSFPKEIGMERYVFKT
jgi:hypothetical protein